MTARKTLKDLKRTTSRLIAEIRSTAASLCLTFTASSISKVHSSSLYSLFFLFFSVVFGVAERHVNVFVLQEGCWTHGSAAGVCWRTRRSSGFGADRRLWSRAGCLKRVAACRRSLAATGSAAGLSYARANLSTTRTMPRRGWRACWTCMMPSKGTLQWHYRPGVF